MADQGSLAFPYHHRGIQGFFNGSGVDHGRSDVSTLMGDLLTLLPLVVTLVEPLLLCVVVVVVSRTSSGWTTNVSCAE